MDGKDLIIELMDFDLDAVVEVTINSSEEDDDFEFELEESSWGSNKYLSLKVDLKDYVLVDKNTYEELKEKVDGLESEVEELREMLAENE